MESPQGKQPSSSGSGATPIGNQPTNDNTPGPGIDSDVTAFLNTLRDKYGWERKDENDQPILFLKKLTSLQLNDSQDGFSLALKNGNTINWHFGQPDGESILGQADNFGMEDAHAIIALSAARGWKRIDVQGTDEQQDMLWLAAKMQGLEVVNHTPKAGSQADLAWKQYQDQHRQTPGASPEAAAPPVVTNHDDNDNNSQSVPAPDNDPDGNDSDSTSQSLPAGSVPPASPKKTNPASSFFSSGVTDAFNASTRSPDSAPVQPQRNWRQGNAPRRGTAQP